MLSIKDRLVYWNISASEMKDRFCMWLAWILPKRLVMWCAIRVGAHATGPMYPSQVVPELNFMDAIKRWETA